MAKQLYLVRETLGAGFLYELWGYGMGLGHMVPTILYLILLL